MHLCILEHKSLLPIYHNVDTMTNSLKAIQPLVVNNLSLRTCWGHQDILLFFSLFFLNVPTRRNLERFPNNYYNIKLRF